MPCLWLRSGVAGSSHGGAVGLGILPIRALAMYISQRIAGAHVKEYNLGVHATTLCGYPAATDSER